MSGQKQPDKPQDKGGPNKPQHGAGGARAWVGTHRGAALAGAGVLLAMALVPLGVGRLAFRSGPPAPAQQRPRFQLEDALALLDQGEYTRARKMAEQLRRSLPPSQAAGPAFVLGAAAAYEAEEFLGRERKDLFLLAANYLEDARRHGFPENRHAEGLFLLGKSLNMCGRYAQSRAALEEVLPLDAEKAPAIHWLLAVAYSKGDQRDLPTALQHVDAFLNDESVDLAQKQDGFLEKLRILYQTGDDSACEDVLAHIPRESTVYPDAELIRGRMAIRSALRLKRRLGENATPDDKTLVRQEFEKAIQILRRAQDDPMGSQAIRRSMYLIGVCFLEMQDYPAALTQFERTRKVWLDSEEGQAAGLQEADMLRRAERHDEAMTVYGRVLSAARTPFANSWIQPEQFRGRVLDAYRQYLAEHQFERAVTLAENLSCLFSPARAADYTAEALRAWSAKLLSDADKLIEPEATAARQQSRAVARRAGRMFADVARYEFTTRQYPDDLWRSAESFLQGHDFRSAVVTFEEYLKHESRRQRPRALINMGECYLALNRLDEALSVCQECIEFYPTDAASFQARLITCKAFVEKGDMAAAERVLRENLNGEFLAPESREWRESLFRLGELLQAEGRYEEAIARLHEAVERYPDSREAVRARYLIAESYRQLAKLVQEKLVKDTIETTRTAHFKDLQTWLTSAVQYYKQVQESLNAQQERARLSALDKSILRNSYFAEGAAWFDLGRYDNAIRAYSTVINRYQHDPEALEAFVQMATCYRRSNKPVEARGTIQQAKVVLNRMNKDAPFTKVTNSTRREWLDLLEWLSTL